MKILLLISFFLISTQVFGDENDIVYVVNDTKEIITPEEIINIDKNNGYLNFIETKDFQIYYPEEITLESLRDYHAAIGIDGGG